jgi:outer membrane protein assembly factor BamB
MRLPAIALLLVPLAASFVSAQEWTRFRGPNGSGVSQATTIPATWTDADYNWKIDLPGIGHSSPVVWKDKIFLMSGDPEKGTRFVLAINAADGATLWKREFPGVPHHLHSMNSYATCTPAVDADHVYVAWSDPDKTLLKALDHQGEEQWSVNLGSWVSQHGFGTSPMIVDDLVIIGKYQENSKRPDTGTPSDSFILAVDRHTGEERWRTKRATDTTSYSVPCVRELPNGEKEIISCSTAEGIFALDPKTGEQKWNLRVFSMRTVSSPVLAGDYILGTTGSGGGGNYVSVIQPGKEAEEVYRVKTQAPYVPTPVVKGDLLFLWFEKGIVTCVDAKTGEQHWQQRIGGNFQASPVIVNDKLYCVSEAGDVVVLAADKEFKHLGTSSLGDDSRSTPAISGGRMYLRTYSKLFSIGGKST